VQSDPALAQNCSHPEIGIDPSLANSFDGVFLGEALGQTFQAEHVLVESVSVWRVAYEDTNATGMRLFITATDSLGQPDLSHLLSVGPDVYVPYGDGVNPIRFDFVFDTPLRLPSTGKYYFAVQAVPCAGFFDILAANTNDYYPPGEFWAHGRNFSCGLRSNPQKYPGVDLVFQIRFCDPSTPTMRGSWGQLKVIYR
jgi:hypothetical protein